MSLELTARQAHQYLSDLSDVIVPLAHALVAVARLVDNTPHGAPPEAMLNSLAGSWETLDSRFREVYAAAYGHEPQDTESVAYHRTGAQEGLGTAELQ